MVLALAPSLLFVLAFQDGVTSIAVGDLIRRAHRLAEDDTEIAGRSDFVVVRTTGSAVKPRRELLGEELLLDEIRMSDREAALEADGLPRLLRALAVPGAERFRVDFEGGKLVVDTASAAAAERAIARLRAERVAVVDVELRVERVDAKGSTLLLSGRQAVPTERPAVLSETCQRSYLVDYDVEVAQGSCIAEPRLETFASGTSAVLRARPLPGGKSAVVEALVRTSAPFEAAAIDLVHPGFGPIDRAALTIEEAATAFRASPGEPVVVSWSGANGALIKCTWTLRWRAPAESPGDGAIAWSPLLGGELLGFRSQRRDLPGSNDGHQPPRSGHDEPWRKAVTPDALGARDLSENDRGEPAASGHWAAFVGVRAKEARDRLLAAADALFASAESDVLALDVAAGSSNPEEGRLLARCSGRVLRDLPAAFTSSKRQSYLASWGVEIAQAARVPDPSVATAEDGWFLNLLVPAARPGVANEAEIDLELVKLEAIEATTATLDLPISGQLVNDAPKAGSSTSSISLLPSLPQDRVRVEKPVVRRIRISGTFPLDADGQAFIRRSAEGFLGAGREVLVRVRVR